MKKKFIYTGIRIFFSVFILLLAVACSGRRNEAQVLPPETSPLSQSYVGYGVINVLYARLNSETTADSAASGHARIGTVVRIHERRLVRAGGRNESWLMVEEESKGWIREDLVNVYSNLSQARTASEAMR